MKALFVVLALFFGYFSLWCLNLHGKREIDKRATIFVQEFEREAFDRGLDLSSRSLNLYFQTNDIPPKWFDKFSKFKNQTSVGTCQVLSLLDKPTIIISEQTWMRLNYTEQKALIFHELGHCWLFKHHASKFVTAKTPRNVLAIMRTNLQPGYASKPIWNDLVDDLFSSENFFQDHWYFLELSLAIRFLYLLLIIWTLQIIWHLRPKTQKYFEYLLSKVF